MKMTQTSFYGDTAIKAGIVANMQRHIMADELIQGATGEDGKGCFIFCAVDAYDHDIFSAKTGIPKWFAHLAERIYEGLSVEDSKWFASELLAAVPKGLGESDFESIRHKQSVATLNRRIESLRAEENISDGLRDQVIKAIRGVIACCQNGKATDSDWSEAAMAARAAEVEARAAAARAAAWSAVVEAWSAEARAAAWSAAAAAAAEAAEAAEAAAMAARAAAWSAEAEYKAQADSLIAILRAAA